MIELENLDDTSCSLHVARSARALLGAVPFAWVAQALTAADNRPGRLVSFLYHRGGANG